MTAPEAPEAPERPAVIVSRREREVLHELLRDGASNAQIGARLYLSEDTVKCHVKQLLAKTGRATRTALAVGVLRDEISIHVNQPARETRP